MEGIYLQSKSIISVHLQPGGDFISPEVLDLFPEVIIQYAVM